LSPSGLLNGHPLLLADHGMYPDPSPSRSFPVLMDWTRAGLTVLHPSIYSNLHPAILQRICISSPTTIPGKRRHNLSCIKSARYLTQTRATSNNYPLSSGDAWRSLCPPQLLTWSWLASRVNITQNRGFIHPRVACPIVAKMTQEHSLTAKGEKNGRAGPKGVRAATACPVLFTFTPAHPCFPRTK
jgi:hypothetical protein